MVGVGGDAPFLCGGGTEEEREGWRKDETVWMSLGRAIINNRKEGEVET